jgi:putative addiction module CopG family antidote
MSALADGERYSVKEKLAELLSSARALNPALRPTPAESLPDASFAAPMRERYLRHDAPEMKRVTPLSAPVIALPPSSSPQLRKTLVGLTPGQVKALSPEEFRACFAATPSNALRPVQRMLIEGDKEFSKIARDILDSKTRKKRASEPAREPTTLIGLPSEQIKAMPPEEFRACFAATALPALTPEQLVVIDADEKLRALAHGVLNQLERKQCGIRIVLPKKLGAFIAQQIEEGSYRDASEVISEGLRFLQRQTEGTAQKRRASA